MDFGARMYDPRLAKFKSVDLLFAKNPNDVPYQFAGNSPILNIDKEGKIKTTYIDIVDEKTGETTHIN